MTAMILKEFRELRRDRRTLAMLVILPILLLVIFGYAANFNITSFSVAAIGPEAAQVPSMLAGLQAAGHSDISLNVVATHPDSSGEAAATDLARRSVAQLIVDTSTTPPTIYVDGSNLFVAQSAKAALGPAHLSVQVLFNPELKTSWYMVPSIIGLIMGFIGTVITSLGLVRERQTSSLEQLAVMPLRPVDIIVGKIAPYFVLASLDMIVVTLLGVAIFHVPFAGSVLVYAVGGLLFLFAVLGLGVLISTVSQTQGQAIQTALMILLPQILLSGMIFPLTGMPWSVRWLGYLFPLTYFSTISRGVMLRGAPVSTLVVPLVVLAALALILFGLSVLRFRRDVTPRRPRHHAPVAS